MKESPERFVMIWDCFNYFALDLLTGNLLHGGCGQVNGISHEEYEFRKGKISFYNFNQVEGK